MKQFIREFINFFVRPLPFIKRHLWYSLLVLIVNFVFYAGLILLVNRLFEVIWIENIFQQKRKIKPSILGKLIPLFTPLLNIMQPLMLYLSYSFALSTIITDPILGLLSRSVERDIGYVSSFPKDKGGIKNFFVDFKEELFMSRSVPGATNSQVRTPSSVLQRLPWTAEVPRRPGWSREAYDFPQYSYFHGI